MDLKGLNVFSWRDLLSLWLEIAECHPSCGVCLSLLLSPGTRKLTFEIVFLHFFVSIALFLLLSALQGHHQRDARMLRPCSRESYAPGTPTRLGNRGSRRGEYLPPYTVGDESKLANLEWQLSTAILVQFIIFSCVPLPRPKLVCTMVRFLGLA